jgi:hypothetical protein
VVKSHASSSYWKVRQLINKIVKSYVQNERFHNNFQCIRLVAILGEGDHTRLGVHAYAYERSVGEYICHTSAKSSAVSRLHLISNDDNMKVIVSTPSSEPDSNIAHELPGVSSHLRQEPLSAKKPVKVTGMVPIGRGMVAIAMDVVTNTLFQTQLVLHDPSGIVSRVITRGHAW